MSIKPFVIIIFLLSLYCCGNNIQTTAPAAATEANMVMEEKIEVEEETDDSYLEVVASFISYFKKEDRTELAKHVIYPLHRSYSIPAVKNEKEFVERFSEIFSDFLVQEIIHSDPATDWETVGWRGIMFSHGLLWLDELGNLTGIHLSKFEQKKNAELIEQEKEKLHPSIAEFKEPSILLKTEKFLVRIDYLGESKYRYASWSANSKMTEKPDLILFDGAYSASGTGGNHQYDFTNGDYQYRCSINVIGPNDIPPAELEVFQKEERILHQRAEIIRQ